MKRPGIIKGQKITPGLYARALEFRKQMTPAEKRLWEQLRGNRLCGFHFRRQQIIAGYIVDFYCHATGLIVEVDGPVHKSQEDYDAQRTEVLSAMGLSMLRFSNEQVEQNIGEVLETIKFRLKTQPPIPPSLQGR
jgi:very-short-patch-repair endonuclease